MMANRQRNLRLRFRVTEEEKDMILHKMELLGTTNLEAYLRKMAIDGKIIHLDFTDIQDLTRTLRITSNSLNQLTKRAHETGNIYQEDIIDLRQSYFKLWEMSEKIMLKMAKL